MLDIAIGTKLKHLIINCNIYIDWASIRGAAAAGLGAPGRHDARLQGAAGRVAAGPADTLGEETSLLTAADTILVLVN